MTQSKVNEEYTSEDHKLREHDRYARAKYHATMRWLKPFLRPRALLYNVGVGSGYFNHLAVNAGLRVVGCEPDLEAFAAADRTKPLTNCELLPVGLAEFARGRPAVDFIVMHDVMEHIDDDEAAAGHLLDLLKPGGRAILSVPALQSLFGRHDVELGHHRRYTKKTFTALLAPRFKIVKMRYFGMASIPIVLFFSVLKKSAYPKVASTDNILSRVYGTLCNLESYVDEPVGTALIAEITRI